MPVALMSLRQQAKIPCGCLHNHIDAVGQKDACTFDSIIFKACNVSFVSNMPVDISKCYRLDL